MNLPKLKTRDECVKFVEYNELDALIKKVYGIFETPPGTRSRLGYRSFSVVSMEEWLNGQEHSFDVKKKPLDKFDKRGMKDFMINPFKTRYFTDVLLNDLCNNGYIEPGTYVVEVWW